MKKAVFALLLAGSVGAQEPIPVNALRGSTLSIRGSTTVGARWSCSSKDVTATAVTTRDSAGLTSTSVRQVFVLVSVSTLRCQSRAMERAMLKALRADDPKNTSIIGNFITRAIADSQSPVTVNLGGSLIVAGVEKQVTLDASIAVPNDSLLHVQAGLPLLLSDFRIEAPRVLFGIVRARDAISVDVDLYFLRRRAP